eukprot:SM005341S18207  [mRNA]  locus=s5341:158:592:+ [translate_table: standard]
MAGWAADGSCAFERQVLVGAGAKILGRVHIGDGAKIGANAVVLTDIPAYSTAVGVPAKVKDGVHEPDPTSSPAFDLALKIDQYLLWLICENWRHVKGSHFEEIVF